MASALSCSDIKRAGICSFAWSFHSSFDRLVCLISLELTSGAIDW